MKPLETIIGISISSALSPLLSLSGNGAGHYNVPLLHFLPTLNKILFYSILFYSILFYSILFYSINYVDTVKQR